MTVVDTKRAQRWKSHASADRSRATDVWTVSSTAPSAAITTLANATATQPPTGRKRPPVFSTTTWTLT
jgi:hypothetical protein